MKSHLVKYIEEERRRKGFSRGLLVELMGYRNITKGVNRLLTLEREGCAPPEFLEKLIEALHLDKEKVKRLAEIERKEHESKFERWASKPVRRHMIIRWMPTVYSRLELPYNIQTGEEAVKHATQTARKYKKKVWLVLSRKITLFIDEKGEVISCSENTPYKSTIPHTTVGGKEFLFSNLGIQ